MENPLKNIIKNNFLKRGHLKRFKRSGWNKCPHPTPNGQIRANQWALWAFCALFLFVGCGNIRQIPVETTTKLEIRDSVIVRDSVVIVPLERIKEIVPVYDTLHLETSLAKATAYIDTTAHILKGSLENKEQVIYKFRYLESIKEVRDTTTISVPVEIEKEVRYIPKWAYYCLACCVLAAACLVIKILKLFK